MSLRSLLLQALLISVSLMPFSSSYGRDLDACDELFEERADLDRAHSAAQCYVEFLDSKPEADVATKMASYDGAFLTLIRIIEKGRFPSERSMAAKDGTTLVSRFTREFPNRAEGHYWNALFLNLDCRLKDEGRKLRPCFSIYRPRIISSLEKAIQLAPSVHGYGPDRLYGVILLDRTFIFGPDPVRGLNHLERALENAPYFSENYIAVARGLLEAGRTHEARARLLDLTRANCLTMQPRRSLECAEDQAAADQLLRSSLRHHVLSSLALGTFIDVEFDFLSLLQRSMALADDRRVVDEDLFLGG